MGEETLSVARLSTTSRLVFSYIGHGFLDVSIEFTLNHVISGPFVVRAGVRMSVEQLTRAVTQHFLLVKGGERTVKMVLGR